MTINLNYYKGVKEKDKENEKGETHPDGFTVSEAREEIKNPVGWRQSASGSGSVAAPPFLKTQKEIHSRVRFRDCPGAWFKGII